MNIPFGLFAFLATALNTRADVFYFSAGFSLPTFACPQIEVGREILTVFDGAGVREREVKE